MGPVAKQKIEQFFSEFPLERLSAGQSIFLAGENPRGVYYIEKGAVCAYDITPKGNEIVVMTFKSPSMFPLIWALTDIPNRYFFKAITKAEVRLAPRARVVELLKENPAVMYELMAGLYTGVESLLGRITQLMGGSTYTRLVYELVLECRRFGVKRSDGSWFLAMSESELAARSGLARETISREVQKLKHLLEVNRHGITIRNLEKIEQELK